MPLPRRSPAGPGR